MTEEIKKKTREELEKDCLLGELHKEFLRDHFGKMKYQELFDDFVLWMRQKGYLDEEDEQ